DVGAGADRHVAQVGEVVRLGAGHQVRLLGLDEVADPHVRLEHGVRTQVANGPTCARSPTVDSLATVYGLTCAPAATSTSVSTQPGSARAAAPVRARPRRRTPGPIQTSGSIGPTSASM